MSVVQASQWGPSAFSGGGLWWLYRHEMRLNWRGVGGKRIWVLAGCITVLWAILHFAAWKMLARVEGETIPALAWVIAGSVYWFFFLLMVSQSIAHAVVAVFDRGDLDLLLSSPLPARHVLAVRGFGIASGTVLLPAALLLPLAHVGPWVGRPGLLAIYLSLLSSALLAAAVGIAFTLSLVKAFGARRAKTMAQVLAAFFGAGAFLISQLQTVLSGETKRALMQWAKVESQPGGLLAAESALWWPVRGMQGEGMPLCFTLLVGVGAFAGVIGLMQRRFAAGAQESVTGGTTGRTRMQSGNDRIAFASGAWRLMLVKEWRLLLRDPHIISQTLLQVLYLTPMLFLAFRSDKAAFLIVPGIVMIASMLAGNLAWLTMAAEDAPELIGVSPIPKLRLRMMKAIAAILPASPFVLIPALWWLQKDSYAALTLVVCGAGGLASAALCHLLNPRRGDRKNMRARYQENRLVNFLEALTSMGWAALAVCLHGYLAWAPLALGFCALGPTAAWFLGRAARQESI